MSNSSNLLLTGEHLTLREQQLYCYLSNLAKVIVCQSIGGAQTYCLKARIHFDSRKFEFGVNLVHKV